MTFYSRFSDHCVFILPAIGVGVTGCFWIEFAWLSFAVGVIFGDLYE